MRRNTPYFVVILKETDNSYQSSLRAGFWKHDYVVAYHNIVLQKVYTRCKSFLVKDTDVGGFEAKSSLYISAD